jgi:hypothetical protein
MSGAELTIGSVNLRAVLNQKLSDKTVSTPRCVVKCGCSEFVFVVDDFRVSLNNSADVFQCANFCRLDQVFELTHGVPRHAIAMILENSSGFV